MNRLTFLSILMFVALMAGIFIFNSCTKNTEEDNPEGIEAAKELCDCLKSGEVEEFWENYSNCLQSLIAKYEQLEMTETGLASEDESFMKAFNKQFIKCNINWEQ